MGTWLSWHSILHREESINTRTDFPPTTRHEGISRQCGCCQAVLRAAADDEAEAELPESPSCSVLAVPREADRLEAVPVVV